MSRRAQDQDVLVAIGRRLRRQRALQATSQEQLAARAGLSPQHVSMIERARIDMRVTTLVRLAAALDVPVEELLRSRDGDER